MRHSLSVRTRTVIVLGVLALTACKDDHYRDLAASTPSASAKPEEPASPPHESPFLPQPSASAAPVDTVICQHVLVAWRGVKRARTGITRSKDEAKARAEEVLKKARAGEDFTDLVTQYSDDPAAQERLGSTGKFKRPDMDKRFSDAAFSLAVNQVSDVVETQFGYHVIKRNQ